MTSFKRPLKIAGIILASILGLMLIGIVCVFSFFDLVCPIVQTPLGDYTSDDGKHIVSVYISDGGATTPWTVVAQVQGPWVLGKRTIYAKDNIEYATVRWIDDRTVWINGIALDIYKDKYINQDN